jgi:hypothetical protein
MFLESRPRPMPNADNLTAIISYFLVLTNSSWFQTFRTFYRLAGILQFQVAISLPLILSKKNSLVRVRERTIPTERPPLVGEVIANFCG